MSGLRLLASHTVLYGGTYMAGRLLNFLLTPYYTRYFTDQADFGAIGLVYAYITFFNVIYTYGMETGFFFFANRKEDSLEPRHVAGTAFWSLFTSSLFFSALLFAISPFGESIVVGYEGSGRFVRYAALILFFDTLAAVPFAELRRQERAMRFASFKFVSIVLNIAFNLFFLEICPRLLQPGVPGLVSGFVNLFYDPSNAVDYVFVSNILASVITLGMLSPVWRRLPVRIDVPLLRQMFLYSWPLVILGLAGMANETLGRIMLQYRLRMPEAERLREIGVYTACYRLSIFMTLAIQSFRFAAEPFFFKRLNEPGGKQLFARGLQFYMFALSGIFLLVGLFLPAFIQIIGRNYRAAADAVPVLLAANLFLGLFYYQSQWYKQTRKNLLGAWVAVGGAVITIAINYLFIPHYGYIASAWANFACYACMALASWWLSRKHWPVPYKLPNILFTAVLALGIYAAGRAAWAALGDGPGGYLANLLLLVLFVWIFVAVERPGTTLNMLLQPIVSKWKKST